MGSEAGRGASGQEVNVTDEERKMLKDLHDAFFKAPHGKQEALIVKVARMADAYEKGHFLARIVLFGLPMVAAVLVAAEQIRERFGP